MNQTWEVFVRLKDQLENHVRAQGFILTKEVKDGAFGSHYVEFMKEEKGLQLLWDGKDSDFAIRVSKNIHAPFHGWQTTKRTERLPRLPWDQPTIDSVLDVIGSGIDSLEL